MYCSQKQEFDIVEYAEMGIELHVYIYMFFYNNTYNRNYNILRYESKNRNN